MNITAALRGKSLNYSLLAIVLALALYMRLDNLGDVQRFFGDQSNFYHAIMNWKQEGLWKGWPLLGAWRGAAGDSTIGPGWYYVIAPGLFLTNFGPTAGAATCAILSVCAIFLYWLWIMRTTGSAVAALATAFIFAFSVCWVTDDRVLWSPQMIPFSLAALACLIEGLERRPLPCLALFLMLAAVLPHWHTTGVPLLLAALPPAALAVWRARADLRAAPLRAWLLWGLALLAVLVALYLPPLIHELRPGPGNMRHYIRNTLLQGPPPETPLAQRVTRSSGHMILLVLRQTFFPRLKASSPDLVAWLASVAAILTFLGLYGRLWFTDRRRVTLSPMFLASVVGGYGVIMIGKGPQVLDYFLLPVFVAPVLLVGWTGGHLLRAGDDNPARRILTRSAGLFIIVLGLTLSALQAPAAWSVHDGHVSYGFSFRDSRRIARHIVEDAGGRPFSLIPIDGAMNSPLTMHVLTRMMGARSSNDRVSLRRPFERAVLGERLYIIVRGRMDEKPLFSGPAVALDPPARVANALIYRLPVQRLPADFKSIRVRNQPPHWTIEITLNTPAPNQSSRR